MKISLRSNSWEVAKLSDLELDCGYSYSIGDTPKDELNTENSWAVKVFLKLENTFVSLKKIPEEDKRVVGSISASAKFLNDNYEDPDYTQDMQIVMNVNSKLNKFLKGGLSVVDIFYPPAKQLNQGLNDNAGYIHIDSKKMVIGASLFLRKSPKEKYSMTHYFVEKLGLERAVQFVVFHEASHAFEHVNKRKHKPSFSSPILELEPITNYLSLRTNKNAVDEINKDIKNYNSKELAPIEPSFMREIRSLHQETYADTGAFLLVRNNEIVNGTYSKEKMKEILDVAIEARQREQFEERKIYASDEYVSSFNHFTSPGLEFLKTKLDTLPDKVLSPLEIHRCCEEVVQTGVARVLLSSAAANRGNAYQLNSLFHLNLKDGNLSVQDKFDDTLYNSKIAELANVAGKEWFDLFSKNLKEIKENRSISIITSTWHAGINQKAFKDELMRAKQNNVSYFSSFSDYLSSPESNWENNPSISNFAIKDKQETINDISNLREKVDSKDNALNPIKKQTI